MNGHLASIHDGFTNTIIANQSKKLLHSTKEFWIGLNTLQTTGNWAWTDNTTFHFQEWGPSEPQSVLQACVSMAIFNGVWKSLDCSLPKAFACEISLISSTIASTTIISTSPPTSASSFSSSLSPSFSNCKEGWVYFEPTQSCYGHDGYSGSVGDWCAGEQYCQQVGGHLVSLHSYDEARFLSTLFSFTSEILMIGLMSNDKGVSWSWSDNSSTDYLPWRPGYPRYNASSCEFLAAHTIYQEECTNNEYVVCKKLADVPTQTPTPSYPAYQNCTEGWVYFELTHPCYGRDGYNIQHGNWSLAEEYCQSFGGHLPSLHSYDEARFLSTAAEIGSGGSLWTGLRSYDNEASWTWSDDTPLDYLPWYLGHPYWNVSSCVYLFRNSIYESECRVSSVFVCKKPATTIKLEV